MHLVRRPSIGLSYRPILRPGQAFLPLRHKEISSLNSGCVIRGNRIKSRIATSSEYYHLALGGWTPHPYINRRRPLQNLSRPGLHGD